MSFIRDLRDTKDYFFQRDEKSFKILKILDFSISFIKEVFIKDLKDLKDFLSNLNPFQSLKSLIILDNSCCYSLTSKGNACKSLSREELP